MRAAMGCPRARRCWEAALVVTLLVGRQILYLAVKSQVRKELMHLEETSRAYRKERGKLF